MASLAQVVPWLWYIVSWYFTKFPVGVPGEPDAMTGNTCLVVGFSFKADRRTIMRTEGDEGLVGTRRQAVLNFTPQKVEIAS